MSFVRIYLHTVWTTKDRFPFLNDKFRSAVFDHIREYAKSKDICIDHLNGISNHVHCLISMKAEQNIATILHLIKGESSHWINLQKFIREKFSWQDEYFAESMGESQLDAVRKYIRDQEEHHKKKTFQQEYDEFMENYGFSIMKG